MKSKTDFSKILSYLKMNYQKESISQAYSLERSLRSLGIEETVFTGHRISSFPKEILELINGERAVPAEFVGEKLTVQLLNFIS